MTQETKVASEKPGQEASGPEQPKRLRKPDPAVIEEFLELYAGELSSDMKAW